MSLSGVEEIAVELLKSALQSGALKNQMGTGESLGKDIAAAYHLVYAQVKKERDG